MTTNTAVRKLKREKRKKYVNKPSLDNVFVDKPEWKQLVDNCAASVVALQGLKDKAVKAVRKAKKTCVEYVRGAVAVGVSYNTLFAAVKQDPRYTWGSVVEKLCGVQETQALKYRHLVEFGDLLVECCSEDQGNWLPTRVTKLERLCKALKKFPKEEQTLKTVQGLVQGRKEKPAQAASTSVSDDQESSGSSNSKKRSAVEACLDTLQDLEKLKEQPNRCTLVESDGRFESLRDFSKLYKNVKLSSVRFAPHVGENLTEEDFCELVLKEHEWDHKWFLAWEAASQARKKKLIKKE